MSTTSQGAQTPGAAASEYNMLTFLMKQLLSKVSTTTLVKVVAVTNSGGVSPVGFVDLQPVIAQLDGKGEVYRHAVVHGVPYFRLQGGANAVILDPQVGDLGVAVFADKDISTAVAAKDGVLQSSRPIVPPGSGRRFDMADALYIGGMLNGTPQQYVQFASGGISVVSPTKIQLQAPDVEIVSTTLAHNGVNIGSTHKHGGVAPGGSDTGGPH